MVLTPDKEMVGQSVEMVANHHPEANEMDAYERVLGEAIGGDPTLFAREDYVEEAWRIIDPVLQADTAVHQYASGTWGPPEASQLVVPPGGWHIPVLSPAPPQNAERRAA